MTEHKTMNTVVHAAFRRDLNRFDRSLASFPAGSRHRADQLNRVWAFFENELHQHHHYEEDVFWPALQSTGVDLSLVEDLGAEHEVLREALVDATTAMTRLGLDPSGGAASSARSSIGRLTDVLFKHLDHEERDMEPISAAHANRPEMKAAVKRVIKSHRGQLGSLVAWLQDGADADARRGLRREIPPPVVFLLATLPGRKYRRDIGSVWT